MWLLLLLLSVVHAQDIKDRLETLDRQVQERLKELKKPELPQASPEEKERLRFKVEELRKKVEEEKSRFRYENGRIVVEEKKEQRKILMADDERLYILMSSSVPRVVWINYARAIEDYGLSDRAFLLLRGCIGGCRYIKPTLEFIQSIIAPSKDRQIRAEVWIDPLVFRRFSVQRVPCFVYVRGDQLFNPELSPGLSENLKSKGFHAMSCGDWAFEYHLQELCKKGAKSLCGIASQGKAQRGK